MRVPAAFVAVVTAVVAAAVLAVPRGSRAAPRAVCARALESASAMVQVSEVEADPVLGGTDTADEWFELANAGASTVTLTNWTVSDAAASDPLPAVTIAPGHCVVVAATSAGFLAEHPGYAQPFLTIADGAIGNGLANGGDVLSIQDAAGAAVDCVGWGSATACFSPAVAATAANTSATLQRASVTDTDTAADWAAAGETPCAVAPTAARVSRFHAAVVGRHAVRLTWRPLAVVDLAGFRVWRRSARGLVRASRLLPAAGAGGHAFVDRGLARPAGTAYRLQAVRLDGRADWVASARAA